MNRCALFLIPAVMAACSAETLLQPDPPSAPRTVSSSRTARDEDEDSIPGTGRTYPGAGLRHEWSFTVRLTFTGTLEPAGIRLTGGGSLRGNQRIDQYRMTGHLVGWWYFVGTGGQLPVGAGSVGRTGLFIVEGPEEIGTFECHDPEAMPDHDTALGFRIGTLVSCEGTGDFAGRNLEGEFARSVGGSASFQFDGVIY